MPKRGPSHGVGSVGDSYDKALAETINGLDKAAVIHRHGPWRSFEAVEFAPLEWLDRSNNRRLRASLMARIARAAAPQGVDWFNNRRLREPIGNIPPAQAEAHYDAALDRSDMAA